jgi:hypothetical protein
MTGSSSSNHSDLLGSTSHLHLLLIASSLRGVLTLQLSVQLSVQLPVQLTVHVSVCACSGLLPCQAWAAKVSRAVRASFATCTPA